MLPRVLQGTCERTEVLPRSRSCVPAPLSDRAPQAAAAQASSGAAHPEQLGLVGVHPAREARVRCPKGNQRPLRPGALVPHAGENIRAARPVELQPLEVFVEGLDADAGEAGDIVEPGGVGAGVAVVGAELHVDATGAEVAQPRRHPPVLPCDTSTQGFGGRSGQ